MKSLLTLMIMLAGLFIFANALGDEKSKSAWKAERVRLKHIYRSRPRRIDEPLRTENVSDEEIREIQAATVEIYPGAIANVSGVISGCQCEEGPKCDSQVWILAYRDGRYDGLMLSRIESKWVVGPLQTWWLYYDRLRNKISELHTKYPTGFWEASRELRDEQLRLQEAFPECVRADDSK